MEYFFGADPQMAEPDPISVQWCPPGAEAIPNFRFTTPRSMASADGLVVEGSKNLQEWKALVTRKSIEETAGDRLLWTMAPDRPDESSFFRLSFKFLDASLK